MPLLLLFVAIVADERHLSKTGYQETFPSLKLLSSYLLQYSYSLHLAVGPRSYYCYYYYYYVVIYYCYIISNCYIVFSQVHICVGQVK